MILPFLAQRLFLIQISWNSKSVLSLGSYTWKNGQIRSAGRTVRQNRRFSGDRFFHILDHLESIWKIFFQQKFSPKKTFEIYRTNTWVLYREEMKLSCHRDKSRNFSKFFWAKIFAENFFPQIDSKWSKTWKKRSPENCRFCRTVRPADRIWPFLHV